MCVCVCVCMPVCMSHLVRFAAPYFEMSFHSVRMSCQIYHACSHAFHTFINWFCHSMIRANQLSSFLLVIWSLHVKRPVDYRTSICLLFKVVVSTKHFSLGFSENCLLITLQKWTVIIKTSIQLFVHELLITTIYNIIRKHDFLVILKRML